MKAFSVRQDFNPISQLKYNIDACARLCAANIFKRVQLPTQDGIIFIIALKEKLDRFLLNKWQVH